MVVNHLVDKILNVNLFSLVVKVIIDFFSTLTVILCFIQARNGFDKLTDLVPFQISINGIVISNVPKLWITGASATHMIVDHMKYFMPNQELNFFGLEHHNEPRIVIEFQAIGSGCTAPFISINQLHTSRKVTKE